MTRLAPPKLCIGVLATALLAAASNASALSLFEDQPYQRELGAAWAGIDHTPSPGLEDVATFAMLATDGEARPHWRSEFNPLNLTNTGGNGFIQPALPIDRKVTPPEPAALAMTGIGLATFLGGRRKTKADRH